MHNTPQPLTVLGELARVLAPGAGLTVLVLVAGGLIDQGLGRLGTFTRHHARPTAVHREQVAEVLHASGMATVHTHRRGSLLRVSALKRQ